MSRAKELQEKLNKNNKQTKLSRLNERLDRIVFESKFKITEFLSDEKWYFDAFIKSTGFKIDPLSKFTGPSKGILVVDSATFNKLKKKSVIGTYGDFKILKSTLKNKELTIEVEYRDYDSDIFTVTLK